MKPFLCILYASMFLCDSRLPSFRPGLVPRRGSTNQNVTGNIHSTKRTLGLGVNVAKLYTGPVRFAFHCMPILGMAVGASGGGSVFSGLVA